MTIVDVHRRMEPQRAVAVGELLAQVEQATGRPALSDHLRLDLAEGGGDGFLAVTLTDEPSGRLVGYAQASEANDNHALEVALDPARAAEIEGHTHDLVAAALAAVGETGGQVNWWVLDPPDELRRVAAELGMTASRTLFQMRRPLPTDHHATVETRAFVVESDEAAWLEVNNRAFAEHGEQGGWTPETLRRREGESWFDAEGFRLHERDGRLAAFCWTKEHGPTATDPRLGEIYVIAVDPSPWKSGSTT